MYMHMYIHVQICLCILACLNYMRVDIFIYTYIYIYICIHINIYAACTKQAKTTPKQNCIGRSRVRTTAAGLQCRLDGDGRDGCGKAGMINARVLHWVDASYRQYYG